jgi:hypothetical protein
VVAALPRVVALHSRTHGRVHASRATGLARGEGIVLLLWLLLGVVLLDLAVHDGGAPAEGAVVGETRVAPVGLLATLLLSEVRKLLARDAEAVRDIRIEGVISTESLLLPSHVLQKGSRLLANGLRQDSAWCSLLLHEQRMLAMGVHCSIAHDFRELNQLLLILVCPLLQNIGVRPDVYLLLACLLALLAHGIVVRIRRNERLPGIRGRGILGLSADWDRSGGASRAFNFGTLVDIELKVAFLEDTVREYHLAIAVLYPTAPFALIYASISPLHLAIAVPLILAVLALVYVPRRPCEHAIPLLLVVHVVALVLVARLGPFCGLPAALPVLQALQELAHVETAVLPRVLPFAVRLPLLVLARVGVAVLEEVGALAVFEAVAPLALVAVPVLPGVHAVALGLGVAPLADVAVAGDASPDAVAVLEALVPLAVVDLAVVPGVHAFTMGLAALEEAEVGVGVGVAFEAAAVAHVLLPLALVLAAVAVAHDPAAVALAPEHLPHVEGRVLVTLLLVVRQLAQDLEVELRALEYYVLELWLLLIVILICLRLMAFCC